MFDRVLNSSLTNIQSSFIHFKYQKNLELKYCKGIRERKNFSNSILTQLTLRFMELWVCSVYYENRLGSFVSRLNFFFQNRNFGFENLFPSSSSDSNLKFYSRILSRIPIVFSYFPVE